MQIYSDGLKGTIPSYFVYFDDSFKEDFAIK